MDDAELNNRLRVHIYRFRKPFQTVRRAIGISWRPRFSSSVSTARFAFIFCQPLQRLFRPSSIDTGANTAVASAVTNNHNTKINNGYGASSRFAIQDLLFIRIGRTDISVGETWASYILWTWQRFPAWSCAGIRDKIGCPSGWCVWCFLIGAVRVFSRSRGVLSSISPSSHNTVFWR